MTAEVAILNRNGVALAADSAMTWGEKIYTSNKIFTLSKYHPVGIMIYGSSAINDMPWETVIKYYRQTLDRTSFPSLNDYFANFIEFLKNSPVFTKEIQERFFINRTNYLMETIRKNIMDELKNIQIKGNRKLTKHHFNSIPKKVINEYYKSFINKKLFKGYNKRIFNKLLKAYDGYIEKSIDAVFESLPLLPLYRNRLKDISIRSFLSNEFISDTGIVITGFGQEELLPSIISLHFDGIIEGEVKYKIDKEKTTAIVSTGCVVFPFAQSEMTELFMNGISRDLWILAIRYLKQTTDHLKDKIINAIQYPNKKLKNLFKQFIEYELNTATRSFFKEIKMSQNILFSQPVLSVVSVLPKNELPIMAETLVNLESFKKRVTEDIRETVGGPIDVAVITKGDGFIWIKRKHYFEERLNRNFFLNYLKS